jgi:hypothetical protein
MQERPRTRAMAFAAAALAWAAVPAAAAPALYTFPQGRIIKWVAVSNGTPCSGRPVILAVGAQHPTVAGAPVDLYVDGSPGAPQFVQLYGTGQRTVRVFAITRERIEDAREIPLDVQACPTQTATLQILHGRNPFHRYRVDFRAKLEGRPRGRLYQWYFGDGQTTTTAEPFVSHDYSNAIKHAERYTQFTAIVVETSTNLASARNIAVASSFALSREMGFVQADVESTVTKTGTGFVVGLDVRNHHKAPIVLERYIKQYLPCDTRQAPRYQDVMAEAVFGQGAAITRPGGPRTPGTVALGVGGLVRTRLVMPLEKVPEDTCVIGFNLIGRADDRRPVYGSFYLPVRRNERRTTPVTDPKTLAALAGLVQDDLVPSADRVTGEDLYLLWQKGKVARTGNGWRRTP